MLVVKNLKKSFDDVLLFENLNLNFQKGKSYALIGKSGSGKTTLLNILAKLEPYDSADMVYKGKNFEKYKKHLFYRNELAYLFQNFGLIESSSLRENLDLALLGAKISRKEKDQKELEALALMNLAYLNLDDKIYTLSGGEAQRVALAKVILKNPSLILADEPTAALDPKTSDQIIEELLKMKDNDKLIIVATHNPLVWDKMDEIIRVDEFTKRK